MRPVLPFLLSALTLAGFSPAPDARQEQEPPPTTTSKAARAANKKLAAQMEGAWRLVDMQLVETDKQNLSRLQVEHAGYCLVGDGYLSIEFHIRLTGPNEGDWGRAFVTGLHKFEFLDPGRIEMTTVIGTGIRPLGLPQFETPGTKRIYDVTFAGPKMTLTREDGHRLVFDRLADDRRRFDIYGRPIREKEDEPAGKDGEGSGESGGERKKDG